MLSSVRIASLVPSSTEMLFALGLGDQVVAVTHECDFPPEAAERPKLTSTVIPEGLSAGEIDAKVREFTGEGRHLYELDHRALAESAPDLIVAQALCEVCAVSYEDVRAIAATLPSHPEVISLDPETLEDVMADVERLGRVAEVRERAGALRRRLEGRLERVRQATAGAPRPRVLALEWLDPPFIGGHWVPEMIKLAGGTDVLGRAGQKSRSTVWGDLRRVRPEVVVAMPCGWDAARARQEVLDRADRVESLGADRVIAVDAAASYSRPGPRLVEGTELLAHLLHPSAVDLPPGVSWEEVEIRRAWA
jgi:iron complex transport system substrate-binding protein